MDLMKIKVDPWDELLKIAAANQLHRDDITELLADGIYPKTAKGVQFLADIFNDHVMFKKGPRSGVTLSDSDGVKRSIAVSSWMLRGMVQSFVDLIKDIEPLPNDIDPSWAKEILLRRHQASQPRGNPDRKTAERSARELIAEDFGISVSKLEKLMKGKAS